MFEERSTSSTSDDDQGASLLQASNLQEDSESSLAILMQVMVPFLVAGLGMVGAGLVLDLVQVSECVCVYLDVMCYLLSRLIYGKSY